ncbi:DUF6464 family protein [Kovacikia minuta CCNUW1]|uniref:DUF6464 family protein n=1 Tax=Kovacikia minuta TaxID=2931930 RepID=UPI001CCBEA33|nr:DUF6464 family protein [Kovacikia minuta]UBF27728.1 DUF6464 family protein [Kovacikia minuta CCNUW1]
MAMITLFILVTFAIALIPGIVSLFLIRKAESRAREQVRTAMNASVSRRLGRFYGYPLAPDHQYVEGVGYMFGDLTCRFNARSPYLRCAVNPSGPCKECPYYESIDFK